MASAAASSDGPSPPAPSAAAASSSSPTAASASAPTPNAVDADPLTDNDDAEGAKAVAVPSCSAWFAMDKINPIEKRMLPEFFDSKAPKTSKSAEVYLKYRNYMVHAYRQQPQVFLTATACRRNLAGDACAILRVHEFLTHWGLINFHVPPHNMPPALHPNYSLKEVAGGSLPNSTSPIAMLVEAKKENSRRADIPLACEACGSARGPDDSFFELTKEAKSKFTTNGAAVNGAGNATPLTSANGKADNDGKEMTLAGFALRPGSGVCAACYVRGAFPEGYDTSDFTLMPTVTQNITAGNKWTDEETNAMLEAVSSTRSNNIKGAQGVTGEGEELSGSCDWNYVAAKVGTKTADECLLHFLEMPLMNQTDRRSAGSGVFKAIHSLQPFSVGEALNAPVLDLASLVEQVDPLVAKAAAHAAIGAIKRLHLMPAVTEQSTSETPVDAAKASSTTAVKVEDLTDQSSFQGAVVAVAESAETAGIASTVKKEDALADDDVAMVDVSSSATETALPGDSASKTLESDDSKGDGGSITREVMAVTEEAANATTVALVAARAQKIANDTATGPVRDLVNQLLENQLRQMELKMHQLGVLEQTIAAEKDQLAKEKYQFYVDRLSFAQEKVNGRPAPLNH